MIIVPTAARSAPTSYMSRMSKPLTILYFAWMRERVGLSQEELSLPEGVATVAQLVDWLSVRDSGHASAFENPGAVRCAVNQEFADYTVALHPGDEVAFFPPVTGG
jgi:sulfur-carrier protein